MTPKTLRRKLRKKINRKPYRKCLDCGGRMRARLVCIDSDPKLVQPQTDSEDVLIKECWDCKKTIQLFWSGDVTGRHLPH